MRCREDAAYHEAGHAVAAVVQGLEVQRATIAADHEEWGCVEVAPVEDDFSPEWDPPEKVKEVLEPRLVTLLAGRVAEELRAGGVALSETDESDWGDRQAVVEFADCLAGGPEQTQTLVDSLIERARELLIENWPAVAAVAQALLERETLSGEEVAAAIGPRNSAGLG